MMCNKNNQYILHAVLCVVSQGDTPLLRRYTQSVNRCLRTAQTARAISSPAGEIATRIRANPRNQDGILYKRSSQIFEILRCSLFVAPQKVSVPYLEASLLVGILHRRSGPHNHHRPGCCEGFARDMPRLGPLSFSCNLRD